MTFISLLALGLLCRTSLCEENKKVLVISNQTDLMEFATNVNSGKNYYGKTVLLDSDIVITNPPPYIVFPPIGGENNNEFRGTFDGQGYMISNYTISTTFENIGFFGASGGAYISNLVLDSHCFIKSSQYNYVDTAYVGGIIGFCGGSSECRIANCVNMASVEHVGVESGNYYLGGIVGSLFSEHHRSVLKNCVNYGKITHRGACNSFSGVGGIAGFIQTTRVKTATYNCLNYGTIESFDDNCYPFIGGIAGIDYVNDLENCVNLGIINSSNTRLVGAIAGSIPTADVVHCYWDSVISNVIPKGGSDTSNVLYSTSFNATTFELSKAIVVNGFMGNSLVRALNAFVDAFHFYNNFSRWAINDENKNITFITNGASTVTFDSRLILLPGLANDGSMWFDGWYADENCTIPVSNLTSANVTELYGRWEENLNNYTIYFESRGGTPQRWIKGQYLSTVTLPKSGRHDGCEISHWENRYGEIAPWRFTIPPHDVHLYAVWLCTSIRTADDLIAFSKVVNSGASPQPATVFLDSDIEFDDELSHQFSPIGNDDEHTFTGTFDGQGYVIKNLAVNSSLRYIGLFGYFGGASIKNVVMDASCSVGNNYGTGDFYMGGIVGYSSTINSTTPIESCVNMAAVSFYSRINSNVNIGGIAGLIFSESNLATLVNCANYGPVSCYSEGGIISLGGILGYSEGKNKHVYVVNCLSSGSVYNYGTKRYHAGGIVGQATFTVFENCVSTNTVNCSNRRGTMGFLGGSLEVSSMTWCYWRGHDISPAATDSWPSKPIGTNSGSVARYLTSFSSKSLELNSSVLVEDYNGTSLVGALNAYKDQRTGKTHSAWILNKLRYSVTFKIAGRNTSFFKRASQLIFPPDLAGDGRRKFEGWFEDQECKKLFSGTTLKEPKTLYGKLYEIKEPKFSSRDIAYIVLVSVSAVIFIAIVVVIVVVAVNRSRTKRRNRSLLQEQLLFND